MGFELAPDHGDRGEPDVKLGRTGGAAVGENARLVESGLQVLARRALLRCGFCDHADEAIEFLARGTFDAPENDVMLIARIV